MARKSGYFARRDPKGPKAIGKQVVRKAEDFLKRVAEYEPPAPSR